MISLLRKVCEGKGDAETHRYFLRFGKGNYERRFLLSANKGAKLKIKTSFELANDLVSFAKEIGVDKFTGKVLSKNKVEGLDGKKKAGVFVYEVQDSDLSQFSNVYYYLVDSESGGIKLKMKKALPKPGKDADKIDDGFCSIELDLKFWDKVKETFFWDVPDGKKIVLEHELKFTDIVFPKNEKDPVKIRENSLRKGVIARKGKVDNSDFRNEYPVEA
ncbi:MAG: hypothetical protein AABX66_03035 [Nanoarchaeota archaeon]